MAKDTKTSPKAPEAPAEPTTAPLVSPEVAAAHGLNDAPHAADTQEHDEPEQPAEADKPVSTDNKPDEPQPEQAPANEKKPGRLKRFFHAWWHNKKLRYGSLAVLAAILALVGSIPTSRYYVLNNVGVRSSASVVILDNSTQQPLKNVDVTIAQVTGKTDETGTVHLSHIKLGPTTLTINRRAFAPVTRTVTIGWGSNPLGNVSLTPTGSQYNFTVTDFLSNKGIAKAEAVAGDADSIADDKGQLVLTIDPSDSASLTVTIKADGYRDVTMTLNLDDKSTRAVKMVPAQKHAFVSKRSGKFDLYAIDVDGANEKLILAGTGNERPDLSVVPHPSASMVAYVSSRDSVRDDQGYLLDDLYIIDLKTALPTLVSRSEKIEVVDWIGNKVIFVQEAAGASANDPNRQRLISYDYTTNSQKELASSNYFFDLVSAGGSVYYASSDLNQTSKTGFFKVNPDGSGHIEILAQPVWNIFRTQYDHLSLSVGQSWYDYKIGNATATQLSGAPASQENRVYQDDSTRSNSLWTDSRDGKGVLLKYDTKAQQDTILRTQSGLGTPLYWLNDHYVVYRIQTDQETADYVLNLDGGQPRKIVDVTNSHGLGQWYYYNQ